MLLLQGLEIGRAVWKRWITILCESRMNKKAWIVYICTSQQGFELWWAVVTKWNLMRQVSDKRASLKRPARQLPLTLGAWHMAVPCQTQLAAFLRLHLSAESVHTAPTASACRYKVNIHLLSQVWYYHSNILITHISPINNNNDNDNDNEWMNDVWMMATSDLSLTITG